MGTFNFSIFEKTKGFCVSCLWTWTLASRGLHYFGHTICISVFSVFKVLLPEPNFSGQPPYFSVACPGLDDNVLLVTQNSKSTFFPWTGYQHCKLDVIFQLEQGEELWIEGRGFFQSHSPGMHQGPVPSQWVSTYLANINWRFC